MITKVGQTEIHRAIKAEEDFVQLSASVDFSLSNHFAKGAGVFFQICKLINNLLAFKW